MIGKIKLYAIFGIIGLISCVVVYYWNTYSLVKTKSIKQKSDSISTLKDDAVALKKQIFSIKQDLDIAKQNESKFQIVIAEQKKRASEAFAAEKRATEAIEHYENAGLMRYFIKSCFNRCYEEVDNKPDCIKSKKK